MGSCVSHCSRQDVVHQQTGRVITDVHKSIEISSGIGTEIKDLCVDDSDLRNRGVLTSVKLLASESGEVRDQINAEIRALREQLVRSQVLFTYLLKNSNSESTKSPDGKKELCTLLEGATLGDSIFHCKSFDGQALARLYNRSNRSSSSYTSHRSTPMHCGYTSLSCPTLPIDYPVVTKSTQTDPFSCTSTDIEQGSTDKILEIGSIHSLSKGASLYFSPPSTPCENIPETFILSDICEIHREAEDHSYPRHRTNSFLSAIKEGNPKLIDAEFACVETMKPMQNDIVEIVHKSGDVSKFMSDLQPPYVHIPNVLPSKYLDLESRSMSEDDNKECVFPRKLSILLEEEHEDTSGHLFSVCSSQPIFNRKRKVPVSCNAKTQTDVSMSLTSQRQKAFSVIKKSDFPISETGFLRCGYTIVSHAVQKRTVFSEELPRKLVLRHPPPYTKKNTRRHVFTSSGDNCFQDFFLKPKTHIYKWATVGDSLPIKSASSQILSSISQNSKLQTRHLSLEKQESFSSCDHSLYPDSRMSSATDCSGWITKSDVELNIRPELPSYEQSILASQRSQYSRNSKIKVVSADALPSIEKIQPEISRTHVLERAKSDGDSKLVDEKNGNNKEKMKHSQRSMRRGSGAGSPNSQLSIPRYPAFDYSEQEDVHTIFLSPSELEAIGNIKDETLQAATKLEKSDPDAIQNGSHLKEATQKKLDSNKCKTLMPEFMENSETESTKGSFECEIPDLPTSSEASSVPVPDITFPSLPNTFLAKLGVHKDSPLPVEAFDEHDLESKFIALSLAFKTDRTTLSKRLELHKRQRDMAEKNVDNEFQTMREHLNTLNLKATSSDVRDLISKIQNHLDIAQQATARVSGRSETYGAVQQEERVSRAFEVLVVHVDHLKRLFDKEHKELEETRRILSDTKIFRKDPPSDVVSEDQKKYSKTFGLPVGSIKSVGRRRASVSDFHPRSFLENCRSPGFSQSWTSGVNVQKVESIPNTLYSYSLPSSIAVSSNSPPISPLTSKPPTDINTSEIPIGSCLLLDPKTMDTVDLKSEVASNESIPPPSPFHSKSFCRKKEKNIWTRKLSAVSDEKEQSEEESDQHKTDNEKTTNEDPPEITQSFLLRDFLQQVEKKNNEFINHFDDEFNVLKESLDENVALNENMLSIIVKYFQQSTIDGYRYLPAFQEFWKHNSAYNMIRYSCGTVLAFIALCVLLSLLLPCIEIHIGFDFLYVFVHFFHMFQ